MSNLMPLVTLVIISCSNMTHDEAIEWYRTNKSLLNEVVVIVENNPPIRLIGSPLKVKDLAKYGSYSKDNYEAHERLEVMRSEGGIESIQVSRSNESHNLQSIRFLLDRSGIFNFPKGYFICIAYIPDKQSVDIFKARGYNVYSLSEDDWYVMNNDDILDKPKQ